MSVASIRTRISENVTEVAKAREAQKEIIERVGVNPDTRAVLLESADDKTKWQSADAVIEARLRENRGLRADLELAEHEAERAELAAERESAAKNSPAPRSDSAAPMGLGEMVKAITLAGGESSRAGAITLPLVSVARDESGRNRAEHLAGWRPTDSTGRTVLGDRLAGDRAHVSEVETLTVDKSDAPGGIAVGTLPVSAQMFDVAQLLANSNVWNTMTGTKLKTRTRGAIAGASGTNQAAGTGIAQIVNEGANVGPQDPTYGSVDLDAYKLGWRSDLTYEVIQDLTPADIEAELRGDMAIAMGLGIDYYIAVGSGANQPQGLNTGTNVVTQDAGSGNEPSVGDLIDLAYSVGSGYANKMFATAHENLAAIRKLGSTSDASAPAFQVDKSGKWDGYVVGYPTVTSPGFPAWAADSRSIVFGDFRRAMRVRLAGPMRIDRSSEVEWANDTIAWRILQRMDSVITDQNAIAVLVSKA